MAWTLTDIQTQISVEVDGNATISPSSTDWQNRLAIINRSQLDWSESYDWSPLMKIYNGVVSTSTGNASLALPSDFRKLDGFPKITWDGTTTNEFNVVDPSKTSMYVDSDKYALVLGNDKDGKTLYIHASTLASGASVQYTYYASPASLVSPYDLTQCPDPTFLVQKALYYLYKSREDARFPEAKAEADRLLSRMVESENARGISDQERFVPTWLETRYSYRVGRD